MAYGCWAWPCKVLLGNRYVSTSSTPHCDASAEACDFQSSTPQRRATRDRGSAVGDGVIPALLFD